MFYSVSLFSQTPSARGSRGLPSVLFLKISKVYGGGGGGGGGGGDLQLGSGWYPLACSLSCVYTKCQYKCSMHKMHVHVCVHACVAKLG